MDITISNAAKELGTSLPRVRRAIERLGIQTVSVSNGGGRPPRRLNVKSYQLLRDDLGAVPAQLSRRREELFVLAALNMNPFGFRSRRDIANATGMSPTTISKIVDDLLQRGIVKASPRLLRIGGYVKENFVLEIDTQAAAWREIEGDVLATHLPKPRVIKQSVVVPRRFWHLFWNASPALLRIRENANYVASRMLLSKDPFAISWAVTHLPSSSIKQASTLRHVGIEEKRWLEGISETFGEGAKKNA